MDNIVYIFRFCLSVYGVCPLSGGNADNKTAGYRKGFKGGCGLGFGWNWNRLIDIK